MNEVEIPQKPEVVNNVVDDPTTTETASKEGNDAEAGPSTVIEPNVEASELDDEILSFLGETPSKEKKYGPDMQKDLALRWEHISTSGLSKEARKELVEKHLIPNNCKKIEAPMLNPEIKAAVTDWLLKKDKALETKQKQQAAAISCISEALTLILSSENRDPKVIKLIIEAGRIMCDSQHTESLTRRSFICSTIKKELKDQLYDTEIDKFLFGEKLADTLKAAKAINRSASEMKVPAPYKTPVQQNKASTSKNSKPQYPNSRPPAAAMRRAEQAPIPTQKHTPAPPAAQRRKPPAQQQQPPPRSYQRAPAPRR